MSEIGFIITGRMKSTRLKKKLTLKINEREIIAHMIDRAKLYFSNTDIVIATSNNPQDDILEEIAKREGVIIYRGHEDDVVLRLYNAALENKFKSFINITADCPLFGYDYTDEIYNLLHNENADLVTSLNLPHGIFTYGIRTTAFKKVIDLKKTSETEVWGDYFYDNPDIFKVSELDVPASKIRKNYRLTLDYAEDFMFFQAIFNHFGKETFKISSDDIISFLDENLDIVAINKDCKALYDKRWDAQRVANIEKNR